MSWRLVQSKGLYCKPYNQAIDWFDDFFIGAIVSTFIEIQSSGSFPLNSSICLASYQQMKDQLYYLANCDRACKNRACGLLKFGYFSNFWFL